MYSEDDIVDLILSGQYTDDINKDDDDYTPETPSSKIDDKNKPSESPPPIQPSLPQQNIDNSNSIPVEISKENNKEKEETKTQNEQNIKKINEKGNNEEKNIKKNIEEKKEDEFFPQFKNPLDFVKYLEIDRVSKDISNEMQNFILENHIKKDNKYEVSEINSYYK
jgi:hypothetical protein